MALAIDIVEGHAFSKEYSISMYKFHEYSILDDPHNCLEHNQDILGLDMPLILYSVCLSV